MEEVSIPQCYHMLTPLQLHKINLLGKFKKRVDRRFDWVSVTLEVDSSVRNKQLLHLKPDVIVILTV